MSGTATIQRVFRALPGARSLQRQLLLFLLLPQLVLWIAGAFVTYDVAVRYANREIDASLSQTTRALARQVKPIGNGLFIDFPRAAQDIIEADPSDRVYYMVSTPPGQFILGNRTLPAPPTVGTPELGQPYYYDGVMTEGPEAAAVKTPVRVAALYVAYGDDAAHKQLLLVQVARSRASRDLIARSILVDTALPLSALILLMSMIVWAGIRAGLQPLNRLRALVENRESNDLAPLQIEEAPQEVRALAKALNTLLAAVQRNVGMQKRFIGDAAHQLRTPLAGLKSQTELALQDTTDPEALRDAARVRALRTRLALVHEGASRSTHLVNQLLTLARAEPESAGVQGRSVIDLRKLASEVTAELVPRALHAGIDLGFDEDADAEPVEVSGIALLLREALVNVLDNAIRYAGRGAVVTMRVSRQGDDAVVEVDDNGPGIAPADRERVLERFVRGTDTGPGCGLGLAIVKEIVERHSGSVTLLGAFPRGLSVVIRLPLLKRNAEA